MTEEAAPEAIGQVEESAPVSEGQAETTWYTGANDETVGYIQNKGWNDDPMKAVTSYQELEKFRGASEDQLIMFPKDVEAEGAFEFARPPSLQLVLLSFWSPFYLLSNARYRYTRINNR